MAKLVLFLQTDVQTREKLTSTSLVEPKHLQHLPPFIIFAAKITIKIIGIWKVTPPEVPTMLTKRFLGDHVMGNR